MASLNSSLLYQEGKKAHWKIKLGRIYQREGNYRNSVETECELYEDFKQLKPRKENGRTRFVVAVKRNSPHILTLKYSFSNLHFSEKYAKSS